MSKTTSSHSSHLPDRVGLYEGLSSDSILKVKGDLIAVQIERESLKSQLLDYNRNDVEATLMIRNWINEGLNSVPPRVISIESLDGRTF